MTDPVRFKIWIAICLTLGVFTGNGHAQQSLFNVPSSEITPEGKLFFQQQLQVQTDFISSTTFAYGLGNNFEVGFNLFDVPLSRPEGLRYDPLGRPTLIPSYLFTCQKAWDINEDWGVALGTQLGGGFISNASIAPRNFTFFNTYYDIPEERGRFIAGPYFAHLLYDNSNYFGIEAGLDIPIIKEKFHFMADFISGTSPLSVAVIGGVFYLPRGWQFSAGAQLPSPNSKNNYGAVFELTYIPQANPYR